MIDFEPGEEISPIEGFPNYWITSFGRVISGPNHKHSDYIVLRTSANKSGYHHLNLFNAEGKKKNKEPHILVAQHFLPNPEGKPTVNHKNGKEKWNNRVDNLEWATMQEQTDHSYITMIRGLKGTWGIKEATDHFREKPYRVYIALPGKKQKTFGSFSTKEEACIARDKICEEYGLARPLGAA